MARGPRPTAPTRPTRASQGTLLDSAAMRPLAALERFLERLFERQTARLFRTEIRPIQVQRRIERTMETARHREGQRTLVPHRYAVRLAPDDLAALATDPGALAGQLADAALAFARSRGFSLLDRPAVRLVSDERVEPGDIQVDAELVASDEAPTDGEPVPGEAPADAAGGPARPVPEHTAVFVVPGAEGPRATLVEMRSDGRRRQVAVEGRQLTIGRATDNGLVLSDGRASRHHARIDNRRGSLVLVDLGSTNGTLVNGRPVGEIALGEGDRIRIGDTILLVETLEPGGPGSPRGDGAAGESGEPGEEA